MINVTGCQKTPQGRNWGTHRIQHEGQWKAGAPLYLVPHFFFFLPWGPWPPSHSCPDAWVDKPWGQARKCTRAPHPPDSHARTPPCPSLASLGGNLSTHHCPQKTTWSPAPGRGLNPCRPPHSRGPSWARGRGSNKRWNGLVPPALPGCRGCWKAGVPRTWALSQRPICNPLSVLKLLERRSRFPARTSERL